MKRKRKFDSSNQAVHSMGRERRRTSPPPSRRSARIALALAAAAVPLALPVAARADKYWKNSVSNGDWSDGNNWSSTYGGMDNAGVPGPNDVVSIEQDDGISRSVLLNTSASIAGLNLENPGGGQEFLDVDAPNQRLSTTYIQFGQAGGSNAEIELSNGTIAVSNSIALGSATTARATLAIEGGTLTVAGDLDAGGLDGNPGGTAQVDVDGAFAAVSGTTTIGNGATLFLGYGAQLNTGSLNLAGDISRLDWFGGILNFTQPLLIDPTSGVGPQVNVSSLSNLDAPSLVVGSTGSGSVTLSGTMLIGGDISLGTSRNSSGTLILNQGQYTEAGNVYVGGSAQGAGGYGTLDVAGSLTVFGTTKVYGTNDIYIPAGGALYTGTLDISQGQAKDLIWSGELAITNSNVEINSSSVFGNELSLGASQELNVYQSATIDAGSTVNVGGGVLYVGWEAGPGTLTVAAASQGTRPGALTATSGILGVGTFIADGPVTLNSTQLLVDWVLQNNSTFSARGGTFQTPFLDNRGTLSLNGVSAIIGTGAGTSAISNSGTILLHNATLNVLGPADLPGKVIADPSTITFNAGVTLEPTGVIQLGTGDKWIVAGGDFTNNSTDPTSTTAGATLAFTGSGVQNLVLGSTQAANLVWGTLDLGPDSSLNVSGGSLQVDDVVVEGNTPPNLNNVDVLDEMSLVGAQSISSDTVNYSGYETVWTDDPNNPSNNGDFVFSNNATYDNQGTFTAENDRNFTGAGTFNNSGFFRKQGSGGTTAFEVPFNNSGTVQAYSGTIQFDADGTDSYPTYFAAAGATIDFHAGNRTGGEYSPTIFTGNGGNIDISGGTFTTYGLVLAPNVGDSINVALSGGTQSLGGVHLGASQFNVPGGVATLSISGTATASDGAINVYNGVIQQSGGTLSTGALYIDTNPATPQISTFSGGNISCGTYSSYGFGILLGNSATTEGRIELTGSASLGSQGGEIVGYYGYGKIQQDGGTNVASGGISIADEAGSSGDYIQNAGSLQTSVLNVGPNGNGSFTLTGGMAEVLTDMHVGSSTGSNGTFTLSGGTLQVDESEYIAQAFSDNTSQAYGSGTFIQNGGTHLIPNQQLQIGEQTGGGTGFYNMNGGTLVVGNGVYVGPNGTFNLNHGVANLNGSLPTTGGYADLGVAGTFTIANNTDASLTINHFEYIYNTGAHPATFNQYGGTQTIAGYLIAGRTSGSSGQYILDNGYASALNVFVAGDEETAGGTATFTINGGEFDVGKEATTGTYDGTVHVWPGGTVSLNGGTLSTGTFTNDGAVYANGGTYNLPAGTTITGAGTITIGPAPQQNLQARSLARSFAAGSVTPADASVATFTIGAGTTFNGDTVSIGDGAVATSAGSVALASASGSASTFQISGGSTTINGVLGVGNSGTLTSGSGAGVVNCSGGALYVDTLLLGDTNGGSGDMTLTGTASVTVAGAAHENDLTVDDGTFTVLDQDSPIPEAPELARSIIGGYLTDGALHVTGGFVSSPYIKQGISSGNTGTFTQSGGTVDVGTLTLGSDTVQSSGSGIGQATISGGTLSIGTLLVSSTAGGVGTLAISGTANVTASVVSNNGTIAVSGGTASFGTIDGAGNLMLSNTGNLTATHIRQATLNISSGASVAIADSTLPAPVGLSVSGNTAATSVLTDLLFNGANFTTSATGSVDLKNNDMIINDASQHAYLISAIAHAYDNGNWDMSGITSSSAAANHTVYGLGYATGAELGTTSFDGQPITSGSTVVKYTLLGDTTLKGAVTGGDYSTVVANFGKTGQDWSQGNFFNVTSGPSVTGSDYSTVVANFGKTASGNVVSAMASPALTRAVTPDVQQGSVNDMHLEVNTSTGDVQLLAETTMTLSLYAVYDSSSNLRTGQWHKLSTGTATASTGVTYTPANWAVAGNSSGALGEGQNQGAYNSTIPSTFDNISLAAGQTIDLGNIFKTTTNSHTLSFEFQEPNASTGDPVNGYQDFLNGTTIDYIGGSTPEPASLGILAAGGVMMMRRRRRTAAKGRAIA